MLLFIAHNGMKIFFTSKYCSVVAVLKTIKNAGIFAEANSLYEMRKYLEISFFRNQLVFNGILNAAAYTIEGQTVYNSGLRTTAVMLD